MKRANQQLDEDHDIIISQNTQDSQKSQDNLIQQQSSNILTRQSAKKLKFDDESSQKEIVKNQIKTTNILSQSQKKSNQKINQISQNEQSNNNIIEFVNDQEKESINEQQISQNQEQIIDNSQQEKNNVEQNLKNVKQDDEDIKKDKVFIDDEQKIQNNDYKIEQSNNIIQKDDDIQKNQLKINQIKNNQQSSNEKQNELQINKFYNEKPLKYSFVQHEDKLNYLNVLNNENPFQKISEFQGSIFQNNRLFKKDTDSQNIFKEQIQNIHDEIKINYTDQGINLFEKKKLESLVSPKIIPQFQLKSDQEFKVKQINLDESQQNSALDISFLTGNNQQESDDNEGLSEDDNIENVLDLLNENDQGNFKLIKLKINKFRQDANNCYSRGYISIEQSNSCNYLVYRQYQNLMQRNVMKKVVYEGQILKQLSLFKEANQRKDSLQLLTFKMDQNNDNQQQLQKNYCKIMFKNEQNKLSFQLILEQIINK